MFAGHVFGGPYFGQGPAGIVPPEGAVFLDSYTVELELRAPQNGSYVWTDVTDDLTSESLVLDYGLKTVSPGARVFPTGTLSFGLRNDAANSGSTRGWYSPYSSAKRSGFDLGIRVRVTFTYAATPYRWMGRLNVARPTAGLYDEQVTRCVAVDWMDDANRAQLTLALQQNQRGDQIFSALVGSVPLTPATTQLDTGSDTYLFGLDNLPLNAKVGAALGPLMMSELGYCGQKRDSTYGQTLFFEARSTRASKASVLTLDDTEVDVLDVPGQRQDIINRVRATIHPRVPESGHTSKIATLEAHATGGAAVPEIPAGATVTFWLPYTDPNNRATKIGAYNGQTPVSGTDWTVNTLASGAGTNLTASCTLSVDFRAAGAYCTLTNGSASAGHITKLDLYGDCIRAINAVTVEGTNSTSITSYSENAIDLDFGFQVDVAFGQRAATGLANVYGTPEAVVQAVSFLANRSYKLLTAALQRDFSDKITLSESVTGIAGDFFIQGVRHELTERGLLTCTWFLCPANLTAWWQPNTFAATGGTITTSGGYKVHAFTTVGTGYTFTVSTSSAVPVTILVVPGGGGPGSIASGTLVGGGAPGDYKLVTLVLPAGTYTIDVGAGGTTGNNGGQSKFDTTIASGGLRGGAEGDAGQNGVYGSGAGNAYFDGVDWNYYTGGTGTRYAGGDDYRNGAGGAAGAGGPGANANVNTGGDGGPGVDVAVGSTTKRICAGGPGAGLSTDGAVPASDYGRGGYYAYNGAGAVAGQQGAVWIFYPTYL